MQTVNSNTLLAKLLATENITVQHQSSIKTAMFDLKNRVLMLPVWADISQDLEHLLLGHETAHAIDTPSAEEYKKAYTTIANKIFGDDVSERLLRTVAGFLNVIEDARIDKRQKRRYPGLRKNYLLGYKELMDRDFFGTKGRDINTMNFIDRLNIYFKGGNVNLNIEFTPEERSFLKRVENLEKFDETVLLTEEVYRFCKGQIENQEIDIGLGEPEEGEGDDGFDWDSDADNSDDFDSEDGTGDDGKEGESDGDEDGEGRSKPVGGEGDLGSNGGGTSSNGAGGNGVADKPAPESITDRTWEQKREELARDINTDYIYVDFPDVNWKECFHDYKKVLGDWRKEMNSSRWRAVTKEAFDNARHEFMTWRQKEKDAISFLVKEFEQRKSAEIYSRISIAKTGVIDTNKLHSYRYNDDIFRRLSVIPEGKNHGFVMFLDWSGSMDYNLKHTLKQLFTLVMFCKQIQVPFEVYAFKDSGCENAFDHANKSNCMKMGRVVLRQFLSSKMNLAELNEAMTFLWAAAHGNRLDSDGMGGTPLNEALYLAPKIVNDFRAKYKLEIVNCIVLTDGEANGMNGLDNDSRHNAPVWSRKPTKYLYNDKMTGKTFEMDPFGWGSANNSNTQNFLAMLKEQTGCNLIGFFLYGESWNSLVRRFDLQGNYEYLQKITKFWKDNKFFPVKSVGYDEYFIIDSRSLMQTENELAIDNCKSNKQMAKAFSKFAAKKSVNRVLLRNFIDHVTGQKKKVA